MNCADGMLDMGIGNPVGEIQYLFLPDQYLFAFRSARFRHLASGHPLGDYLNFLALVANAQQRAINQFPVQPLPGPNEKAFCREHGMPLLSACSWQRNPDWQAALTTILLQLRSEDLPPAALESVNSLIKMNVCKLEQMADIMLAGELGAVSPGASVFMGAALQVYWVKLASTLTVDEIGRTALGSTCPVCGSYPGSSIICGNGAAKGLRFLCCPLCCSRWYYVRITCSNCTSTKGIRHYILEGTNGAVKAECCDDCHSYLKLFYQEKDSWMDPIADDLATLSLDMLMDTEGKNRGGPNLLFHPGGGLSCV